MIDADVRPQDVLTLADFVSVYCFFFGPSSNNFSDKPIELPSKLTQLSLSEIAIQTLQEERWRGTADQVNTIVDVFIIVYIIR